MPAAPLVLVAIASVIASSRRVFIASPWIDPEVAEALLPILKSRRVVVVTRPPAKEKHRRALDALSQSCEILLYLRLHTKLALGDSAVVTSANLTRASLLKNLETGVYYHKTPYTLRVHAQEITASAIKLQ